MLYAVGLNITRVLVSDARVLREERIATSLFHLHDATEVAGEPWGGQCVPCTFVLLVAVWRRNAGMEHGKYWERTFRTCSASLGFMV